MTDELDELPDLWRATEAKYPPSEGWGLKIVRRWLSPNDATWIVQFSKTDDLVGTDAPTVVEGFRDLLTPGGAHKRIQAYRVARYEEELLAARAAVAEVERRLAEARA